MCDFYQQKGQTARNFCVDQTCPEVANFPLEKPECPLCEEKALHTTNYESCGIATCAGTGTVAPCKSNTCPFPDYTAFECTEEICPFQPPKKEICYREDGMICQEDGFATCLTEETEAKPKDYLSMFKYKDFSKYTFNKDKYIPKSYLPGDGADFVYGYGLKPTPAETGAGPCGAQTCPIAGIDYHLNELMQPLPPLPTLNSTDMNYCGGAYCPYKDVPICPYTDPLPCKPPMSAYKPPPPPCPFTKKEPCGAPDCPFRAKKPCGAPDCKYAKEQQAEPCPCKDGSRKKKKKRKHQGDFDSLGSCDSNICPFAEMNKSEKSSSKISCDNPECPFAQKEKECYDKSCPYAKEFTICQDCGGVVVEVPEVEEGNAEDPTNALTSTFEITEKRKPSVSKVEEAPEKEDKKVVKSSKSAETTGTKRKKKKVKEILYNYPGIQLGHRTCTKRGKSVPANMGWLWNIKPDVGDPELWRGYKPGAIPKRVHKMIREHRRALGIFDPSEIPRKKKSKTSQKTQSDKYKKNCLEVKKQDGNYFITVNPVKDPKTVEDFECPYAECTPLQFKIMKEQKKPKRLNEDCLCDEDETESICSSNNSILDFSFSPPAALAELRPRKKKILNTVETQYDVKDSGEPKSALKSPAGGRKKGKKGKKKK